MTGLPTSHWTQGSVFGESESVSEHKQPEGKQFRYNVAGAKGQRLINLFGSSPIDDRLIQRVERLTGTPAHPFLKRGVFFSHRDLNLILDDYEASRPFYIYTGRGASAGSLHLGHLIPFFFTKYLQDAFGAHVVIQITDDEKMFSRHLSFEEVRANTIENIKDIIAVGFDPNLTHIFCNLSYMGQLYPTVVKIQALLTCNQGKDTDIAAKDC